MLRSFRTGQRVRRSGQQSVRQRRPALEELEQRCVLSAPPAVPFGPLPAVILGLTAQQVAHADAVINWNATMLQAIWNAATPPTLASRVEAMVGVAVYDAVDGVHPIYEVYPVPGLTARPAPDASREAAAIAAADTVLNSLYPAQRAMFDAEYQATLAPIPDTRPKADGIAWGQAVGNAVLAWRSQDGFNAPSDYQPAPPGGPPGVYELTPNAGLEGKPPGFLPALAPQWGQVTPWVMASAAQFLPPPPPALDSAEYADAFNQVKSLGEFNSTTRTEDEYQYSHFWADVPGHSVTPPGHWDEIAEHVSLQHNLNLEQNAHLFALLNIGLADAAINCWDAKYVYNFWRPVTAIRDPRASEINPATTADPNWTPLWNTPNFPGYDSGHSTFSGTASVILASLFGPNTGFTNGSDDMPGYSRSFTSFAQAADEAGDSRVVGGIHFQFDNTAGLAAGRELGSYVSQNFLRPLGDDAARGEGVAPRPSPLATPSVGSTVVLAAPTVVQPVGTLPDPVRLAALASLPPAALPTVGAAGSSPVSPPQGGTPAAPGSVVNGAQNSTGLAQPRSTLPGAPGRIHDPFIPAIDSNLLWEALANDLPLDGAV